MSRDLTIEACLRNFETFAGLYDRAKTERERREYKGFIYINRIAFGMMTEKINGLPVTEPETMVGDDAMPFDGTWYRCDSNGTLFALDEMDCIWYEIDIIDDDADVTLYYMDIRSELMRA